MSEAQWLLLEKESLFYKGTQRIPSQPPREHTKGLHRPCPLYHPHSRSDSTCLSSQGKSLGRNLNSASQVPALHDHIPFQTLSSRTGRLAPQRASAKPTSMRRANLQCCVFAPSRHVRLSSCFMAVGVCMSGPHKHQPTVWAKGPEERGWILWP